MLLLVSTASLLADVSVKNMDMIALFFRESSQKAHPAVALCKEAILSQRAMDTMRAPLCTGTRTHKMSSHHTPWENCYICNAVVVSRHIGVLCQLLVENTKQPLTFSQIALLHEKKQPRRVIRADGRRSCPSAGVAAGQT